MSENFRLYRKIGFQNTFYTKCINVIIDSIGPSIILRSKLLFHFFFFFLPNFSGQVFSNHWKDCSEYGIYGFEVVQQGFKMSDTKAGPRACPKYVEAFSR